MRALRKAGAKEIHLAGQGKAGPWVVLARGLCGDTVARTAADMSQFRFEKIASIEDDMMLPGALKYGGLMALAGLAAPAGAGRVRQVHVDHVGRQMDGALARLRVGTNNRHPVAVQF